MQTPHVFVTRSHAGKAIRLTEAVWWEKILVSHPELGERNEYVEEVEKTIADVEYLIQGRRGKQPLPGSR
ncbi:MAG: hypothetical protein HY731_12490 [Candidatus Tectomicrobia bacterium]|nr:hypothetical protein [Candidatus Tectomicrobia bacterium]